MLNQINTKMKLLLFPIIFLLIVVTVGAVYIHYSSIADARNTVAIKTDIFIQNILKGRISVYQFLRNPSQEAALKVKEDFKLLQN
ncbi:chemotaxis protein, partial [Aliarcobacter skirrowii]|nr:chemotaxis protein [Aliarcobacter skirrowii]